MSIAKIHQEIFDFLMEQHAKNEDFFFSLRQINRSGRLDKGYWFLGNEYYLSVSFWMGSDNSTKSPKLTFIILHDGLTYFEIDSKHDNRPFFSQDFLLSLGFINPSQTEVNRKYYDFNRKNYLKSLENFLQEDKIIVDKYVMQRANDISGLDEDPEVDFIWPATFEKQLKIVKRYQQERRNKEKKTGYLRTFHINNFGPVHNLIFPEIPKGCRWVFLTGENGAGKTSVLKALAATVCNNNDHGHAVVPDNLDFKTNIGIERLDGIEEKTVDGKSDFEDKKWLTKGFAAYGPVRLITEGSLRGEWATLNKSKISRRATYGLFSPINVLRDVSGDFILAVRPKYHELTLNDLLENIEINLAIILPNIDQVEIVPSGKGHEIRYFQKTGEIKNETWSVDFEQLPSGTKNFSALILDLLLRFTEQQDDVADIADYVGVVLIDEIDLHLHPKMQKEIIVQLAETFPNIQFIVTTHSPIPMLGAPKDSIFINIHKDENNRICASKIDVDITNMLPNTILTSPIFNFDELINENHIPDEPLMTEDDYNEAIFYRILEKKIRENTINPQP